MDAKELFNKKGKSVSRFYCDKCKIIHQNEELAEACCKPLICECGQECEKYYTVCSECRRKRCVAAEQARADKAEKLTINQWDGPVYTYDGDTYTSSIEEYLYDHDIFCNDVLDETKFPIRLWACTEKPVVDLDFDGIIAHTEENAYEDFDTISDLRGIEEFKKSIKAFNEINKGCVLWEPDYSKLITINKADLLAMLGFTDSVEYLENIFEKNGIVPSRKSTTADNSVLFEFLEEKKVCVDVYPSGVVVVIICKDGIDEIYQLSIVDSPLILELLQS